jgi:hypothetical protein
MCLVLGRLARRAPMNALRVTDRLHVDNDLALPFDRVNHRFAQRRSAQGAPFGDSHATWIEGRAGMEHGWVFRDIPAVVIAASGAVLHDGLGIWTLP